jgi:hypothetical protein
MSLQRAAAAMSVDAWASQQNRIFARINAGKRLWGAVMSEELKPCLHCGDDDAHWSSYHGKIICKCGSSGPYVGDGFDRPRRAAIKWNTRPITLDQAEQVLSEAGMVAVSIEDCTHAANTMEVRNSVEEAAHYRFIAIDDAAP